MLFSCKISSAVLSYLERQNEDLSPLLDCTSLPEEFLRDPSHWMKASEMESFLAAAQKVSHDEGPLFHRVGHAGPELRSWGVLDSVLRMMPKPQEILAQPQRFLSYFISPEPPVDQVVRTDCAIEFDLPISTEIYPLVTQYLKSAFESLPVYAGQPFAQCEWNEIHIRFSWLPDQANIFGEDLGHQISPELLRSVVSSLEIHQRELEEKNRELQVKNEQLRKSHEDIEARISVSPPPQAPLMHGPVTDLEFIGEDSIQVLKHNISRLMDYMIRAQQLITLLVGQDRLSPAVKTAMKKTDWERVKSQFPVTANECREILESTKTKYSTQDLEKQPYV